MTNFKQTNATTQEQLVTPLRRSAMADNLLCIFTGTARAATAGHNYTEFDLEGYTKCYKNLEKTYENM